jgi:hypothetical protein
MKKFVVAAGLAAASISPAFAQDAKRIEALEARIKVLEASAAQMQKQAAEAAEALKTAQAEIDELKHAAPAEATAAAPEAAPEAAPAEAPATATTEAPPEAEAEAPAEGVVSAEDATAPASAEATSPNAFNPAISIILNGQYAHHSLNPDDYVRAGFPLAGEAGPGPQGLSLGESEVAFSSNIDDKFYGQLTLTVHNEDGEDHVGVEEAYIDTTSMPDGFSLRAGRFFSNVGYLNSHHPHTDKFADRPLPYQAFLGNQYGDDGVQLRWVAPTDLFFELGGEVLRGQNFPSGGAGHAGTGVKTAFAHVGGDVGIENSWLAGVSVLKSQTDGAEDGFRGDETLWIADATWKWAPGGNTKDGGIQLRSEYFWEDRDGLYVDALDPAFNQLWSGQRSGAYVEGVWRINRLWETGYRYDKLWGDNEGPYASTFDPYRHTLMAAWRNSEFSMIRLQVSHDKPNGTDTDNTVTLQYQTSLGAHGAHKF